MLNLSQMSLACVYVYNNINTVLHSVIVRVANINQEKDTHHVAISFLLTQQITRRKNIIILILNQQVCNILILAF